MHFILRCGIIFAGAVILPSSLPCLSSFFSLANVKTALQIPNTMFWQEIGSEI